MLDALASSTETALAVTEPTPLTITTQRTPDELVPLIREQLNIEDEAGRNADEARRRRRAAKLAVGLMLVEVKAQLGHGRFLPWLRVNFNMHERTAERYMEMAGQPESDRLSDSPRRTRGQKQLPAPTVDATATAESESTPEKETENLEMHDWKLLARRIIDAGYRALRDSVNMLDLEFARDQLLEEVLR